jgi:protein-tyrosine-phosphatase
VADKTYNVLFLCTGNSARSIIAEAILNKIGRGKFLAWSAGSQPKVQVNPHTLRLLRGLGLDTSGLRSKSWNEFTTPGALALDFILRFATLRREKPVRYGPVSRSRRIGTFPVLQKLRVPTQKSDMHFREPTGC